MVSEMAMEDVEALRAAGGDVPPRDAVRLNALGLKVERASHAPDFAAVPRAAELCGLVFREPTIAAEAWMEEACGVFDDEDWQTVLLLRALSLSKPSAALPDPSDAAAVCGALAELKAALAEATVRQLAAAVGYALHGNDARALEYPEPPAREAEDVAGEEEGVPVWAGVLYRGAVLRLGTVEELRRMRESELLSLVVCAEAAAYGEGWRKSRHARALGEYLRALDAVKARASHAHALQREAHEDEHEREDAEGERAGAEGA